MSFTPTDNPRQAEIACRGLCFVPYVPITRRFLFCYPFFFFRAQNTAQTARAATATTSSAIRAISQ